MLNIVHGNPRDVYKEFIGEMNKSDTKYVKSGADLTVILPNIN